MTVTRLLLAWGAVSAGFLLAGLASRRLPGVPRAPDPRAARRWTGALLGEAGVVTLFAALWFDSLGHGGWWLLFVLVGLLAAFPVRLQALAYGSLPGRPALLLALYDTARYVGAGALLAWRLR
jgi:hypothetical protein